LQLFYSDFEAAFSRERMSRYRISPWDRKDLILARYIYNVKISSSLYNSLHILEVALRNGIHREASKHFRNKFWFLDHKILRDAEILIHPTGALLYQVTALHLLRERKRLGYAGISASLKAKDVSTMANCLARLEGKAQVLPVPAGKVIADTTFGFWTNLFITDYDVRFWHPIIHRVFPHAPRTSSLTRKAMYARLDPMRLKLRNRISHYEPIWQFSDLQARHDEIIETIYWLNKPAGEAAVLIDSFPRIYLKGVNGYRQDVQAFNNYVP